MAIVAEASARPSSASLDDLFDRWNALRRAVVERHQQADDAAWAWLGSAGGGALRPSWQGLARVMNAQRLARNGVRDRDNAFLAYAAALAGEPAPPPISPLDRSEAEEEEAWEASELFRRSEEGAENWDDTWEGA